MNRRQLLAYGAFGMTATVLPAAGSRARSQAQNLDAIETIVVHPAIGIARVGNSPDAWFLGPEAPGPHPVPKGDSRTTRGASSARPRASVSTGSTATGRLWPR